jgi:cation diffusion facilitator family transporter
VAFAVNVSFAANVCLFAIKLFAAISALSLAVIASTVDSFLDLLSGSIIYCAARLAAKPQPYRYPVGKARSENLAIVIFAATMAIAALQLILQGIETLAAGFGEGAIPDLARIGPITYGVMGTVIAVKSVLLAICWKLRRVSPAAAALALDHRNDVVTNAATLAAVLAAGHVRDLWFLDSLVAVLFGAYILVIWIRAARGASVLLLPFFATLPPYIDRRVAVDPNTPVRQ